MRRDLASLARTQFDLLVVGGGVYGAAAAYDAALRGLSVALVEKGDFGGEASANSLKTIHGGLRYVQDANLRLVRDMINERKAFLRIAPHLVRTLTCLTPTLPKLLKSKPTVWTGLKIADFTGFDRNAGLDAERELPNGRLLSKRELLQRLPELPASGITGAAQWFDGQMYSSERVTLAFVMSAVEQGAQVANYVSAQRLLVKDQRAYGIQVKDELSGDTFDIQARVVMNTAGCWAGDWLNGAVKNPLKDTAVPSLAVNLIVDQIHPELAFGISTRKKNAAGQAVIGKGSQVLFFAPWKNVTIFGTHHTYIPGNKPTPQVDEQILERFIADINSAYPALALTREKIHLIHFGFLPTKPDNGSGKVRLYRESPIVDHSKTDSVEGLVTVLGVKFTSARKNAQDAVDLAVQKIGKPVAASQSHMKPLVGGEIESIRDYRSSLAKNYGSFIDPETLNELFHHYGSRLERVLKDVKPGAYEAEKLCDQPPVLNAEVRYAIQEEMAQKLSDLVLRRTGIGTAGKPTAACLQCSAELMGRQMGWNSQRLAQEIDEVNAYFKVRV